MSFHAGMHKLRESTYHFIKLLMKVSVYSTLYAFLLHFVKAKLKVKNASNKHKNNNFHLFALNRWLLAQNTMGLCKFGCHLDYIILILTLEVTNMVNKIINTFK